MFFQGYLCKNKRISLGWILWRRAMFDEMVWLTIRGEIDSCVCAMFVTLYQAKLSKYRHKVHIGLITYNFQFFKKCSTFTLTLLGQFPRFRCLYHKVSFKTF